MFLIQQERVFSNTMSQFYAAEILLGLWYLHGKGVVYRDLKLDNVMLAATGHIKIADFGMCKENMYGSGRTTTFCGTPGYLAPEIIEEKPYGASVDFWSLGVLCYEFLVGDSPFEAEDDDELFDQILQGPIPPSGNEDEWNKTLKAPARKFIKELLNRDPETRLGCTDKGNQALVKSHEFFKGLNWTDLEACKIKPPYIPKIKDPRKAELFDSEFTNEAAVLTPIDKQYIEVIEQSEFDGFSFVNAKGLLGERYGAADGGDDEAHAQPVNLLSRHAWYRPDLGRQGVVQLLRGKEAGAFCVRESASQPGCYALSVSVSAKADKLWTGLITPTDDGRGGQRYRLFVKQKFDSVPELIDFYHSSPCVTIDKGKREVMLVDVKLE